MSNQPLDPDEVRSVLAAREELGPEYEPALVASFSEKIIAEVERRMAADKTIAKPAEKSPRHGMQLALAIVSLVLAIPLTAIALNAGSTWMAIITWIGIVLVNMAFSQSGTDQNKGEKGDKG